MRRIILAAAFVVMAPVTFAQTSTGNMGGMGNAGVGNATGGMGGMNTMQNRGNMPASGQMAGQMSGQSGGENCGTPEEPKSCPPLPRHPLPYYPANKQ